MRGQKRQTMLLIGIMLAALFTMIYYGSKKEGYHVDEMYSYGLANSEYLPFLHFSEGGYSVKDWMLEYGAGESLGDLFHNLAKDYKILKECGFRLKESVIYKDYLTAQANSADTRTTAWVTGQYYSDYLAVSKSNTFNYASVYYNQRGDVHPPLYYILLHMVCSLFQGVYSKWFALCINFAALLLTVWVLYRMTDRFLGGGPPAIAAVLAYALSCGIMTTAMYLRMYALLTLMVVICSYVHLKLEADGFRMTRRSRAVMMLSTVGGFLTHYYFVIYVIVTAVVMAGWMASRKKWRELFGYALTMAASAVIGLGVWPFAIRHVFGGSRGQQSLEILMGGSFHWIQTKVILIFLFRQLYNGWWWIFAVSVLLLLLAFAFAKKGTRQVGKALLLILPGSVYLVTVSQIAPYFVDRYFMCLFPFLCLLVTESVWLGAGVLLQLVKRFRNAPDEWKGRCRAAAVILCGVLLAVCNSSWRRMPGYLYEGGQEQIYVPDRTSCIFVMPDNSWNQSALYSSVLARCDRVAVMYQSALESLAGTLEYTPGDCVLVFISDGLDVEAVLGQVREVFGLESVPETARERSEGVLRIYLTEEKDFALAKAGRQE